MTESARLSESWVLIGYPNGLGISRVVPTKKFSFWPYYKSFIDKAWTVKTVDCKTVRIFARKTLTPRFTDFFTGFEKKKTDCFAVYQDG